MHIRGLVDHYKIKDKAIQKLAKLVYGADVPEDINITPESAGLNAIAEGFRLISKDDHENMRRQFAVYDALYAILNKKHEINVMRFSNDDH